jgi:hypothetical protein
MDRHITPDLCLATSWLHDLTYPQIASFDKKAAFAGGHKPFSKALSLG